MLPESVLTAQVQSLIEAWDYSPKDHLLHVLPLHHVHGTVNAVLAPLFAGSTIEFLFPFNVAAVWERLASPFLLGDQRTSPLKAKITFLTVVLERSSEEIIISQRPPTQYLRFGAITNTHEGCLDRA